VADVRGGNGPRFLHAFTYRIKGHVSVDPAAYRDAAEVEAARAADPLVRARDCLRALGVAGASIEALEAAARDEVAAAVAAAGQASPPSAAAAYTEIQDCGAGRWRS
jgi:pyruvate dehydrogenase E1 component alpha subunit